MLTLCIYERIMQINGNPYNASKDKEEVSPLNSIRDEKIYRINQNVRRIEESIQLHDALNYYVKNDKDEKFINNCINNFNPGDFKTGSEADYVNQCFDGGVELTDINALVIPKTIDYTVWKECIKFLRSHPGFKKSLHESTSPSSILDCLNIFNLLVNTGEFRKYLRLIIELMGSPYKLNRECFDPLIKFLYENKNEVGLLKIFDLMKKANVQPSISYYCTFLGLYAKHAQSDTVTMLLDRCYLGSLQSRI